VDGHTHIVHSLLSCPRTQLHTRPRIVIRLQKDYFGWSESYGRVSLLEYLQFGISLVEFLRGSFLFHENGYEMNVNIFPLSEGEKLENVHCVICTTDMYTRVAREITDDEVLDGVFRMQNTENDEERNRYAHLWCYMRVVGGYHTTYTITGLDYVPLICYSCNKFIMTNPHTVISWNNRIVHDTCFIICEADGCEQEFPKGNETTGVFLGERFKGCDDCLYAWVHEQDGIQCDECSDYVHEDDSHYDSRDDQTYCNSCNGQRLYCERCDESYWRRNREYHNHGYDLLREPDDNPDWVLHGEGKYHLGFELETEFDSGNQGFEEPAKYFQHKVSEDVAFLKSDGSLNNGMEIVGHPMTLEWTRKEFPFQIIDTLRSNFNATAWDTENCGFHVHVSRVAFDNDPHLFRFCKFFRSNVRFLTAFAGRHSTSYAAYDSNGEYESSAEHLKNKVKGRERSRYQAVNTTNEDTVEIRIFRGTLRKDRILANISLVQSLVEFTREMSTPEVAKGSLTWGNYMVYTGTHKETYPELWAKLELLTPSRNNHEG
jgi:hypothetical protein